MRQRNRIHVPGATYYTVRRCNPPHLLFERPADYQDFEEYLTLALEASGAKLLGYCWVPDAIHLVIRVGRRPVSDLMRRITRNYRRRVRERPDRQIPLFSNCFPIILIDPRAHLLQVLQYLHFLPVLAGTASSADDYPYSSRAAYLGAAQHVRVHTKDLWTHLRARSQSAPATPIAKLPVDRPSDSTRVLLERCHLLAPPILGDSGFTSQLPRKIRERFSQPAPVPSLKEITAFVAMTHGLRAEELVSRGRQHELVVARARVAWIASEIGAASLSEIARHLRRDVSSLGRAVTHYRRAAPELFRREAFVSLCPSVDRRSTADKRPTRSRGQSSQRNPMIGATC